MNVLRNPWEGKQEEVVPENEYGSRITEGELYYWAAIKREDNLRHVAAGHQEFCRTCNNCKCGKQFTGEFRCVCEYGKIMRTPYKWRSLRSGR